MERFRAARLIFKEYAYVGVVFPLIALASCVNTAAQLTPDDTIMNCADDADALSIGFEYIRIAEGTDGELIVFGQTTQLSDIQEANILDCVSAYRRVVGLGPTRIGYGNIEEIKAQTLQSKTAEPKEEIVENQDAPQASSGTTDAEAEMVEQPKESQSPNTIPEVKKEINPNKEISKVADEAAITNAIAE